MATSAHFLVPEVASNADPLPPPTPDGTAKVYPEKIQNIVRDISQLTLLETAQLNELLKVGYRSLIPRSRPAFHHLQYGKGPLFHTASDKKLGGDWE